VGSLKDVQVGDSPTFKLIHQAILDRQQLVCTYQDHPREVCPYILGHKAGAEVVLVYQFAGQSNRGLAPKGDWRCFQVSEMQHVRTREGSWHGDAAHRKTQRCVDDVYIDVNTEVPNQPGRR
jgi:predicted DNA-binding transcriptional regulator YafY